MKRFLPLFLAALVGCQHKPVQQPVSVAPPLHIQSCAIKDNIATCECVPVRTNINAKTGKTTVVCKFKINP